MEKEKQNRIGEALAAAGKRNIDLVNTLGVSPVTVSRWISNDRQPDIPALVRIAGFLGVLVDDLVEKPGGISSARPTVPAVLMRAEAVAEIAALYPADAEHKDTAAAGRELLLQAVERAGGWRELPDTVLIKYAELCRERQG